MKNRILFLLCIVALAAALGLPNAPPKAQQNLSYQVYLPMVMDGATENGQGFVAEDGSSLIVGACQDCDCCLPMIIQAKVTNAGNGDMAGTSSYEVWYSPNGNPKDGVKVAEGIIPALKGDPVHEYV